LGTLTSGNTLFTRLQNTSGLLLNPIPLSLVNGQNQFTGVISYSQEYNNRPTMLVPGAISENISIVNNHPGDVFATIPVLARALGPVLQSIGTVTVAKKTVTIEAQMSSATYTNPVPGPPNTAALMAAFTPQAAVSLFWSGTTKTGRRKPAGILGRQLGLISNGRIGWLFRRHFLVGLSVVLASFLFKPPLVGTNRQERSPLIW
jgi:hypothetical protein